MMFYGINFSSVFAAFDICENITFINEKSQHQCHYTDHGAAHLMGGDWANADISVSEVSTELK